jgi:UDP-glucose 4-epimerase
LRALITGGAGFIGSHLAQKLLASGTEVTVIDDLSTGSVSNISHLCADPRFELVTDNVRNHQVMHVLIEKCDVIYHLAAAVGVKLIVDRPVHTIETNIHGSEVVLNIANKFRKKILIASSSEVYGKSENVPFHEDDDTILGSTIYSRWSYAASKAIDEFLALAYHRQFGLEVVITRFFNTIGPRQCGSYGMVVPRFVQAALNNDPLNVYGTGTQSRCFAYVGDVIEAVTELMNRPHTAGRVYNIGSQEQITIENLAKKIIDMTDSKSIIQHIPYEKAYGPGFDDMQKRIPSLDRIKTAVGYQPKTNLDQTLQMVIDDIKKQMKGTDS